MAMPQKKTPRPWTNNKNPPAPVPDKISTPDGREFIVEDLLRRSRQNPSHHNLHNPITNTRNQPKKMPRSRRYTDEIKLWIANTDDLRLIATRLGIDFHEVRALQYRTRRGLKKQGIWTRAYY